MGNPQTLNPIHPHLTLVTPFKGTPNFGKPKNPQPYIAPAKFLGNPAPQVMLALPTPGSLWTRRGREPAWIDWPTALHTYRGTCIGLIQRLYRDNDP